MHDGDSHDPDKSTGRDGDLGARLKAARTPSAADEAYDIRIARDGTWYYQGTPIGRPALVKLFATVLRRDEAGDYWLITPAERGRITVEDAPFVAVALTVEDAAAGPDRRLVFRTNLDHVVEAGPDHPIAVVFDPESGEPRPYIQIKDRLDALIGRAVYYDLVERAEEHEGRVGVWSKGRFFPLDQGP
ncbi:MAG: DUF1285 domain-containing protein [Deinococcus-Thermus bacterium]|nr:DUF1285 domain-containing protein [Deinococcota bacterium]